MRCVETRKKTGFLKLRNLRNFSRHHALYHPVFLFSVQLKVKVRLSTIRAPEKETSNKYIQIYFVEVYIFWIENSFLLLTLFVSY